MNESTDGMSDGPMSSFCGSTFWNSTLTWYTDNPQLTPCFEKTVLVWVPCIFLVAFSPFDIFPMINSKMMNIPWNWRNLSRMAVSGLIALVEAIDLLNSLKMKLSDENIFPVDLYTPILRILSVLYSIVLMRYHRIKGIRTSGVLFIFWLLTTILGVAQFSSEIKMLTAGNALLSSYAYLVFYVCSVIMLFLNFFADLEPVISKYPVVEKPCPESSASFPSKMLFAWFDTLAFLGYKRPLVHQDLWNLNHQDSSNELVPKFDQQWQRFAQKKASKAASFKKSTGSIDITSSKSKPKVISILPILCIMFGSSFAVGAAQKLVQDLLSFVSPQILNLLIDFVQGKEPKWRGFLYAFALLLTAAVQTLFLAQYFNRMMLIGFRIRTVLVSAIYRKALRLSNSARKESTVGEIVNLMSVDAQRFVEFTTYINLLWSAPLQITLALYFLWQILGWSVLAGLAVMIILIPVNGFIATYIKSLQIKQMKNKDERVKMMNEILSGIKVLKLYAWEPSFEQMVLKIREKEVRVLKKAAYFNACTSFIWGCAPFLVSLVTFAVYLLTDDTHVLDAKTAFVSVSLFNLLRFPLSMLPMMISNSIQVSVSIKRINKFMNSEELDPDATIKSDKVDEPLVMEDGTFKWGADENPILKNINLKIKEGSLVAVVGAVGVGKSSLISAFLGEMERVSGRVYLKGSVAYVPQIAWIQNATLQDNILFGKHLNNKFYHSVVDACALKPDLDMLPGGDQTEIGEKGINLSGGQKQRVSLARAVYNDADIYFLDDPLSAVDSHVGKHIFDRVVGSKGILHGKTRIFVTHGITFLPEVDLIVVLKEGSVSEIGTYSELLEKKGAFSEFINTYLQDVSKEEYEEMDENVRKQLLGDNKELLNLLNKQISVSSDSTSVNSAARRISLTGSNKSLNEAPPKQEKDKLIEEEKTEIGGIKWEVYSHYLRSIGPFLAVATVILNIVFQSFAVGSNLWLSAWSSDTTIVVNGTQDLNKRDMYLEVYGVLGLGQIVTVLFASLAMQLGTLKAAFALHNVLVVSILRTRLTFFDVTPLGRIINRFGKDVDQLDNVLPMIVRGWITCLVGVVGTIFVISYTTPMFLAVIMPIGVVYYFVQRYYVATSRQLKRLESVSRSPIYSHFSETVTGASVLRAYNVQTRFIKESEGKVDFNQVCTYPGIIANRWLAVRLEMVGNMIILFSALFVVLGRDSLNAGLAGLSISYALQITQTLNWLVRMTAEVETNIVAVERIKEYADAPQEAAWEIVPNIAKNEWPDEGKVEFINYSLRYREGLDLVLKNLNIVVKGGEKIGIVGRTGAGKSSLTLGLFRIIEPAGGQILIDDVDISKLGLHALRSKLTIIPQDPVLFSGTLRINLDPFEKYSDEQIWRALELAHLKSFVSSLPTLLQHEVSESGDNLSVGQRQLICLARALLRKTKVLVLDEATAAVDLETDDLIQKTIRKEFASCTVLTIAHRINTIMDSDRVLVLDKGTVKEFDAPDVLLRQRDSVFFGMAKDAGIVS